MKRFFLALFLVVPLGFAQTPNFAINTGTTYTAYAPGLNIGGSNFYDAMPLKNLFTQNPSMQAQENKMVVDVTGGTSTTFTWSSNGTYATNDYAGYTYILTCAGYSGDTPGDCGGYLASPEVGTITASTSGVYGDTITFTLSRPSGDTRTFAAHDTVYVLSPSSLTVNTATLATLNTAGNWSNFGWKFGSSGSATWNINTTSGNLPPASGPFSANQCVQITLTGSGDSVDLYQYFDSSSDGSFYHFSGNYKQTLGIKVLSGAIPTVNMNGWRNGTQIWSVSGSAPTTSWGTTTGTFSASETSSASGTINMGFNFTASAASSFCVFNADLENTDQTNPTVFQDSTVQQWQSVKPGVARALIDGYPGASLLNIIAPQSYRKPSATAPMSTYGAAINIGLHDFLTLQAYIGTPEVSWVMSPATSDDELSNWVDYLAGSTSTTYGGYRSTLGHSATWTSVFSKIRIELGNETWNCPIEFGTGCFAQYSSSDDSYWNYVPWAVHACTVMKANVNWDTDKMECAASSQNPSTTAYQIESEFVPADPLPRKIDTMNMYGYGMYDPTSCGDTDEFQSSYVDAFLDAQPAGIQGLQVGISAATIAGYKTYIYEHGNHTIGGSCTQTQVNGWPEGQGQGLVDTFKVLNLCRVLGVCEATKWNYLQYDYAGISTTGGATSIANWGIYTGNGGQFTQPRGTAVAMNVINSVTGSKPTMYGMTATNVPTFDFASINSVPATSSVPLLDAFPFANGSTNGIIVYNFDSSSHTYTLSGSGAPSSGTVTQTITSGTSGVKSNNEGANATPQLTAVTTTQAVGTYTVPAYSIAALSWSAASVVHQTSVTGKFKFTGPGRLQ